MKKKNVALIGKSVAIFMVIWIHPTDSIFGNGFPSFMVEIPSSFNPVGSGARAMGMGGAFIAVANDATAASWNPGGLIRLTLPEFSIVTSGLHRGEDIGYMKGPGLSESASTSVDEKNINYLSAAYPFGLFNRNMVVSLTYQHLYDFNRDWKLAFDHPELGADVDLDYQQTGRLSAIGLSYCIQIVPEFWFGFTLNFWDDGLADSQWKQKYHYTLSFGQGGPPYNFVEEGTYSFEGFNANLGVSWRTYNDRLTLGAVLKTPFTADVEYKLQERDIFDGETINSSDSVHREEMEMPMSYGIGIAYAFSDRFLMSADIYRTEWDDFIHKTESGEKSPVTGRSADKSDVSPTHQVRIGAEYRFMNEKKGYIIPVRAGIFYDPAPAQGSPDDFYGFSLGLGLTRNDWFSLDVAYQYRFGNDVGEYILDGRQFSQDVDEHAVCLSVIFYP